jgi:hypothetical protein
MFIPDPFDDPAARAIPAAKTRHAIATQSGHHLRMIECCA